ncbi:MAG: type I methionyl aminopeptidase [Kiritimatiellae bacterium]|nr:type I methionyl aminopeptidase [Kiritimatiellia bacterium]
MIPILKGRDLDRMRTACRLNALALREVAAAVRPGITTAELDQLAADRMRVHHLTSASLGYGGFPYYTCISVNEEVVHGFPGPRVLNDGDIVTVDLCASIDGFTGDNAVTIPVGQHVDPAWLKLCRVTRDALALGIAQARAGNRVGDIGHAVQTFAESFGYGVVRDFCGHGVGRALHQDPQIPNYGSPRSGARLKPGMCLAIEPMINMGTWRVEVMDNEWTVKTRDRLPAAHFEHTVLVTDGDPEILTAVPADAPSCPALDLFDAVSLA